MYENTVYDSMHGVDMLCRFLEEEVDSKSMAKIDLADLKECLVFINKMEVDAHTQSRVISGIKACFKYLLIEPVRVGNQDAINDKRKCAFCITR